MVSVVRFSVASMRSSREFCWFAVLGVGGAVSLRISCSVSCCFAVRVSYGIFVTTVNLVEFKGWCCSCVGDFLVSEDRVSSVV